uniref:Uncharacterized protein n=1 Tax=Romanomermis culicivorax TaxID=13658 RepID=A0A915KNT8_ROMCU
MVKDRQSLRMSNIQGENVQNIHIKFNIKRLVWVAVATSVTPISGEELTEALAQVQNNMMLLYIHVDIIEREKSALWII